MANIHYINQHDPLSQARIGARPCGGTPLPVEDHRQLQRHLENCARSRHPAWTLLAYVLRDKIMMTDPVSNVHCSDVAIGGSRVTYSIDRGARQTGLLSHRARAASGINVIPVPSLLGATLIGMTVGQRAPLLLEGGAIKAVRLLAVSTQT